MIPIIKPTTNSPVRSAPVSLTNLKEATLPSVFTNLAKSGEAVTQASYVIVQEIASRSKPFSNGEFVQECQDASCMPRAKNKVAWHKFVEWHSDATNRRSGQQSQRATGTMWRALEREPFPSHWMKTRTFPIQRNCWFSSEQSRRTEIGKELLSLESIKDRTRGVNKMRSRLTDLHAVFSIATTATKSYIRGIIANHKQHHKSHANKKKGMLTYQQIFNVI